MLIGVDGEGRVIEADQGAGAEGQVEEESEEESEEEEGGQGGGAAPADGVGHAVGMVVGGGGGDGREQPHARNGQSATGREVAMEMEGEAAHVLSRTKVSMEMDE